MAMVSATMAISLLREFAIDRGDLINQVKEARRSKRFLREPYTLDGLFKYRPIILIEMNAYLKG